LICRWRRRQGNYEEVLDGSLFRLYNCFPGNHKERVQLSGHTTPSWRKASGPLPQLLKASNPAGIQARRVRQLAEELGFDRERIAGWRFAQAVLSAWWSIEDHGYGWEEAITCAEILAALKV
jgi:hypothetical protein